MLFSVIVPVYNLAPFVCRCLDALGAQTISDLEFEVIVINDGSSDNSLQLIQRYAQQAKFELKLVSQVQSGVACARNRGFEVSEGEYIYFLDGDDTVNDIFLAEVAKAILAQDLPPEIVVTSYLRRGQKHDTLFSLDEFTGMPAASLKKSYCEGLLPVNMCTFIFRRSFLKDRNIFFTPNQKYGEDLEFYLKVFMIAENIKVAPRALHFYLWRDGSAVADGRAIERLEAVHALGRVAIYLRHNEALYLADLFERSVIPRHIFHLIHYAAYQKDKESLAILLNAPLCVSSIKIAQARGLRLKSWLFSLSPGFYYLLLRAYVFFSRG